MGKLLPIAPPKSRADIEKLSLSVIKQFQPEILGKPASFDIEAFFELDLEQLSGVLPDYQELPAGIYGYTDINEMVVVIDSNLAQSRNINDRRFRRSTAAHETGHVVMHVPVFRRRKQILRFIHDNDHSKARLALFREENIPIYCHPEWQAWVFARSLLMPRMNVNAAIQEGCSKLELSQVFDLNPAFVNVRLNELKISLK
jgi:Zn-dependent peptidase ImmA (M78 family)